MKSRRRWLLGGAAVVVGLATFRGVFAVDETQAALVVSFGRFVRAVPDAGLHAKWPWHSVLRLDRRTQWLTLEPRETLTRDPKNIVVEPYAVWRLRPESQAMRQFVRAVPGGDLDVAGLRLAERIWHVLTVELSSLPLTALVNEDTSQLRQDEMLRRTLETCRSSADSLGIDLLDVRLQRITRPEGTKDAVYREMIAERAKEANFLRNEGEREAMEIRARGREQADRIVAEAEGQAQVIHGRAEAEATQTYGRAHRSDPEFFLLLNLLETYREILDEQTTLVLSGDSDLFRLLTQGRLDALPTLDSPESQRYATTRPVAPESADAVVGSAVEKRSGE